MVVWKQNQEKNASVNEEADTTHNQQLVIRSDVGYNKHASVEEDAQSKDERSQVVSSYTDGEDCHEDRRHEFSFDQAKADSDSISQLYTIRLIVLDKEMTYI